MGKENFGLSDADNSRISMRPFGKTPEGKEVMLYTLTNKKGLKVDIINYGGIVVRLFVPDRNGHFDDIVLGYNKLEDYLEDTFYFGALIGRYGNRIAAGKFTLDGATYQLAQNDQSGYIPCHLHGGLKGFDKVVWEAEPFLANGISGLKLHYISKDGEEGYPGNLEVTVHYCLTDASALRIEYHAVTDKATPVNLTQHSYFNLKGEGNGDILDHLLYINADSFLPVNKGMIPTGEILPVKASPFDFNNPTKIGSHINNDDEQIKTTGGYDHTWILKHSNGLELAARVDEPLTGRQMEVWTSEPGIQFYSGNFLDGQFPGKSGKPYDFRNGFCLETQHYPDSPNRRNFPSTILSPGETYQSVTEIRFSIMDD